ncbi:MAG: hypothetical protein IPM92_15635 [Saprospiraceae bacterium]|nr:hypothetical protein [Saprospiraceae bacterium]
MNRLLLNKFDFYFSFNKSISTTFRIFLFAIHFLEFIFPVHAQNLIDTIIFSNGVIEEYQVLKNDVNVKHGFSVKYYSSNGKLAILENGNYLNNLKHGLWEYYNIAYQEEQSLFRYAIPSFIIDELKSNKLTRKGNYKNGKRDGIWFYYYESSIPSLLLRYLIQEKDSPARQTFEIVQPELQAYMIGQFQQDQRVGSWVTFSTMGKVLQSYDFSKEQLLKDLTAYPTDDFKENDHKPLFLGGGSVFELLLFRSFAWKFSEPIFPSQDSIVLQLFFNIDSSGHCTHWELNHKEYHDRIKNSMDHFILSYADYWIPAKNNGVKIESKLLVEWIIYSEKISKMLNQPGRMQFR